MGSERLYKQSSAWLEELTRPGSALEALSTYGQTLSAYDSAINSAAANVAGLSALSTDYRRASAYDPAVKSLTDIAKTSGLLGMETPHLEWLNELGRPSPVTGALETLSTDYRRTLSGLDSLAKSVTVDTSKYSGLLGQGSSNLEWLNELGRPSLATEALGTNFGRTSAAYDSVINSLATNVAGLSALGTDHGRTISGLESLAKSVVVDTSKYTGLLDQGSSNLEWLNELGRPSAVMGALGALSTDYGKTYSAYDSGVKSFADIANDSGLFSMGTPRLGALGQLSTTIGRTVSSYDSVVKSMADASNFSNLRLENSQREWLAELARPSSALGALEALSTDYGQTLSGLESLAKSVVVGTSNYSGLLGRGSSNLKWLNELGRPSPMMGALEALSKDFGRTTSSAYDSAIKSLTDVAKTSGLLGMETPHLGRHNELARPSSALGALSAYGQTLSAYDSMVNSAVTNIAGLSAPHFGDPFTRQVFPPVESRLVTLPFTSQPEESDRYEAREHDPFIQVLQGLNPAFTKLWIGAFAALQSGNPDWVRHVAISLRELFTHAVHFMAPDREMETWIRKPEQRTEKGQPTRLARLHFVVAPGIDSLDREDADELKKILLHFQDLHECTHRLEGAVGESEMKELLSKTERFISKLARRHLAKRKLH